MKAVIHWYRWFAWYPIAFGRHIVWLRYVWRRYAPDGSKYYRLRGRYEVESEIVSQREQ